MDKRALRILNDMHWGSSGWKSEATRHTSLAEFAYAKAAGLMFDPCELDHDGIVSKCLSIRDRIDPKAVVNAFVWSLVTRSLAYRSALGSYAVLQHFPDHAWDGIDRSCHVCGSYGRDEPKRYDLNVLSFERHRWGGVRHLQALYAAFDLEQFSLMPPVTVGPEHASLLAELVCSLERVPEGITSAQLQSYLPKALKSNKAERDVLIGILGVAGVLETEEHRGFLTSFVRADRRELPNRRFVDMAYPACWWSQADGVNKSAIQVWFSHLL